MNYQGISAGAMALALFAGRIAAFAGAETTHDGTVVKISSSKMVINTKEDKEHTHTSSSEK